VRRWLATSARELVATRAASPLTIAASLLAAVTWLLLLWAWLYTRPWLDPLLAHLGGVVGGTFVASILTLAIQLAIIIGVGRLAPRDVGLSAKSLWGGLAIGAAAWLVVQMILAAAALIHGDGLALATDVDRLHARLLVDQVAGNALAEEVVYRGFLAVQLVVVLRRRLSPRAAWIAGVALSQLFFGLTHIPQRWIIMDLHGAPLVSNLAMTALFGVFYAVVYVRTGMLGIAIAFHALSNLPFALVESPLEPALLYDGALLVLLAAWPLLAAPVLRTRR
jgi:membrane protease YdiL (CAAX protease family)